MSEPQTRSEAESLVTALADPARRESAFRNLLALGAAARPAIRAGLGDGRFEVRRLCALWMLRLPEPEDADALVPLLRDPRSRVRQVALVAISLAHAPTRAELVALLVERALLDESLRVRRQAVSMLAWQHAHPDLEGVFAELLRAESDPRLRKWAGVGLSRCAAVGRREEEPC